MEISVSCGDSRLAQVPPAVPFSSHKADSALLTRHFAALPNSEATSHFCLLGT